MPFIMPSKHARAKKAAKWLLICVGILVLIAVLLLGFIIYATANKLLWVSTVYI